MAADSGDLIDCVDPICEIEKCIRTALKDHGHLHLGGSCPKGKIDVDIHIPIVKPSARTKSTRCCGKILCKDAVIVICIDGEQCEPGVCTVGAAASQIEQILTCNEAICCGNAKWTGTERKITDKSSREFRQDTYEFTYCWAMTNDG